MSTPSRFTDALKAENVTWPVRTNDLFPYMQHELYWTGFFSSRPAVKKQVKDASAFFNSEQNVFARLLIDQETPEKDIKKIEDLSFSFNDALAVSQHHDAITGTEAQYVAMDYQWRLDKR
jgi:alpha-mannosidase